MENLFIHEAPGCDISKLETMVSEDDIKAYAILARCYLDKVGATYEDFLRGEQLLEQGASKGDDNAMAELLMIHQSRGDVKAAKQWTKKIHALHVKNHQKSPTLQTEYDLAFDLQFGFGVVPDLREAKRQFESLARRGFGQAYYSLGIIYENGDLGRKHRPAAMRRYMKGAALQDPNCMLRVADYYMEFGEHYNPIEAYRLYRMLSTIKYGIPEAQVKMAEYYIYELHGNEQADWEKAKQYLVAAESLGSYEAAILLKALLKVEHDSIEKHGSLEATPKTERYYRLSSAIHAVKISFEYYL